MGSGRRKRGSSARNADKIISDLRERHRLDLESLSMTTRPFKTLQLFTLAMLFYMNKLLFYVLRRVGWLVALCGLASGLGLLLYFDVVEEKHVHEVLRYAKFGLWWVVLGILSSIGLGSGLHTFVMYLGPHIAFFTIKSMQCGRVDLKVAPYDTIQLEGGPLWLEKDCSEFGSPKFPSLPDSLVRIPLTSILPQVQLEAVLWGVGTALGELPPYFISKAARISGSKLNAMEEFNDASSKDNGSMSSLFKRIKQWLFSSSQHLNFFTILLLASIPNPLFDLAGIMCGQFGIPFWQFFLATMTGKAIIKTHIQTVFIILICNNQLLDWMENELIIVLGHIPGFSSLLPKMISKLHMAKEKYLSLQFYSPSHVKDKQWKLSFNLIWNTVLWLMLINFFSKIVTATAQRHLKMQQDLELKNKQSTLRISNKKYIRTDSGKF